MSSPTTICGIYMLIYYSDDMTSTEFLDFLYIVYCKDG